jgi:DNA-binding winged helix-turn-helix (wHTH) protein
MLTREQCRKIIDADLLPCREAFTLDCRINRLTLHARGVTLTLTEPQKRLLVCLVKGINCKRQIINIVWYENHRRISDNNYHQLVFQLRALLKQHQLPAQLILTVPYYGLKLSEPLLSAMQPSIAPTPTATPTRMGNNNYGETGEASSSLLARLMNFGRSFFFIFLLVLV